MNHKTMGIVLTPELTGVDADDLTNQASAAAVAFYGPDVPVHISWAGAATMTRTGAAYKFTAMAIIHAVEDQATRINELRDQFDRSALAAELIDVLFGKQPADSGSGRGDDTDGWPDGDVSGIQATADKNRAETLRDAAREGYSRRSRM